MCVENCCFFVEKMGEIVIDCLVENFEDLMNFDFIVKMEGCLDDIVEGECVWI